MRRCLLGARNFLRPLLPSSIFLQIFRFQFFYLGSFLISGFHLRLFGRLCRIAQHSFMNFGFFLHPRNFHRPRPQICLFRFYGTVGLCGRSHWLELLGLRFGQDGGSRWGSGLGNVLDRFRGFGWRIRSGDRGWYGGRRRRCGLGGGVVLVLLEQVLELYLSSWTLLHLL